jgi:hypothetical protein
MCDSKGVEAGCPPIIVCILVLGPAALGVTSSDTAVSSAGGVTRFSSVVKGLGAVAVDKEGELREVRDSDGDREGAA